jgi:hypothetical protein
MQIFFGQLAINGLDSVLVPPNTDLAPEVGNIDYQDLGDGTLAVQVFGRYLSGRSKSAHSGMSRARTSSWTIRVRNSWCPRWQWPSGPARLRRQAAYPGRCSSCRPAQSSRVEPECLRRSKGEAY